MTTLAAPEFVVVEATPIYHAIYDGVVGSEYRAVAAGSLAFAEASVRRRNHQEREWAEIGYHVALRGEPLYRRYANLGAQPYVAPCDDMPF